MIQFNRSNRIELTVDPQLLEQFSNEPVNEGPRKLPVLPLAQVLKNIDALHAECNGQHVCGLPVHLQVFNLKQYLNLIRLEGK